MKTSLSIVIPAYDEEESLGFVLKDTLKKLPKYFSDYEVIVVDDGSKDKTGEIADSFAKKDKHLKVIHQQNSGYNKAMIVGLAQASKDYVGYMQADGQNLVDDFKDYYKLLPDNDLVIVGRGKPEDYNLLRLILHHGCFLLYYILFGLQFDDPHWVYFWKTKEVQKLKLDSNGGVFLLAESLVKFKRKGLKIVEVPVKYRSRLAGEQKAVKPKVIWRTFWSIIRLWWQIVIGKV
ncbi:MAG: glycosyltransferase family 2 protein [bacterium]|nr:glycosyltransferase family 2 protein [bacterium]